MRVLVTGGAGYIGSTLVPLLLGRGFQVTVLDNREDAAASFPACGQAPGFRLLHGDLLDPRALQAAAQGAEAVVHLAALSGYPACARDPDAARRLNVGGTARVMKAAGDRLPVVLASTVSCYGEVPEGLCDEATAARPVSLYGRTKLEAEALVLGSPRGTALRLATVYGLSPRLRLDLLVNAFVRALARGEPLEVFEPEARRAFVHVQDAARALLFALEHPAELAGRLFNVGDESQNLSKRELAEAIRRRFPDARLSYTSGARDEDRRDYAVSFARLRAQGFHTRLGLEQGIEELAEAFSARIPAPLPWPAPPTPTAPAAGSARWRCPS